MFPSSYTNHYENRLLDDIHNYFPAILYEPEAFHTVQDLLFYVRGQVRGRMNLFTLAQTSYRPVDRSHFPSRVAAARTHAENVVTNAAPPPVRAQVHQANRTTLNTAPTTVRYTVASDDMLGGSVEELNMINNLMSMAMGGGASRGISGLESMLLGPLLGVNTVSTRAAVPSSFMEPVVVRPTQEQIAAGTAIERVDAEEEVCAICQDSMAPGSEARSLNVCDHRFHIGCIDTWFQTSVRCPVCRHDIREPASEASGAPQSGAAAAMASAQDTLTEEEYNEL